jgi:uncharacterized membrane protein
MVGVFCVKSGLGLVFFLLFVGVINVIGVPREEGGKLKRIALEWGLVILISTLVLWGVFDWEGQFQIINQIE